MRDAAIVSTACTGIGKARRGSQNATKSPTPAGHAPAHAVIRVGSEPCGGRAAVALFEVLG